MNAEHVEVLRELLSRCQFERYKEGADAIEAAIAALSAEGGADFADDARNWGDALNEAAWLFTDLCPEKSALLFNNTKAPLRDAILKYAELIADRHAAATCLRYANLTDAQIVEIRDEHLPSQGEAFDCIAFARSIIKASAAAATGAREGWVLVPREPTAAMLDAGIDSFAGFGSEAEVDAVWAAMIAAGGAP